MWSPQRNTEITGGTKIHPYFSTENCVRIRAKFSGKWKLCPFLCRIFSGKNEEIFCKVRRFCFFVQPAMKWFAFFYILWSAREIFQKSIDSREAWCYYDDVSESWHWKSNRIGLGVEEDLIEKPVEGRRGPATVSGSDFAIVHWGIPWEGAEKRWTGARRTARSTITVWTCEGWGRGLKKALRRSGPISGYFHRASIALFRSRERAFLIVTRFFPMVSAP